MAVTPINTFVVPKDVEDEFVSTWRNTINHFASAPGFIDTRLHKNTGANDTAYDYVNIAHWESIEAYKAVFAGFTPAGQRFETITAHPGQFTVIAEVTEPTTPKAGTL